MLLWGEGGEGGRHVRRQQESRQGRRVEVRVGTLRADLNGHVEEGNRGDEQVMGRYGVEERNVEGQMVVDFTQRMEMETARSW